MQLIFSAEPQVGAYVAERLGQKQILAPFVAIGAVDATGAIKAGAVFTDYRTGEDITLILGCDRVAGVRRLLPVVLRYVFVQLKLPRCTAEIKQEHQQSIRLAEWAGFRLEGTRRVTNLCLYGLTRDDWQARCQKLFKHDPYEVKDNGFRQT